MATRKEQFKKKKLILSKLSKGQARYYGFTNSQYQRAVNISKSKKAKAKVKETVKEKKPIKKKEVIATPEKRGPRIRKQAVIEYVNRDAEPYYISIRAMTLNPDITERALLIALLENEGQIKRTYINFIRNAKRSYAGLENEPIGDNEDIKLSNDIVVVILIGGRNPVKEVIRI